MDKYRIQQKNHILGKNNPYAFMIQLKSYLELFGFSVIKHSVTYPESKYIFDAFHDTKQHFHFDRTVVTNCYGNIQIDNSDVKYYQYDDL
jgi:hypothetical protein